MVENNKPFGCSVQGCGMTFTNEDHLTVHKKKHRMSLNLGNGQKNNVFVADQTPTPTRFIRNCEEVGLFQDLQNVNPFEEQFRTAAEAVTSGAPVVIREMDSLAGPQLDDMLHTPHVLPLIESVPCGSGEWSGGGRSGDKIITKDRTEQLQDSHHGDKNHDGKVLDVELDDNEDVIVLSHVTKTPRVGSKVDDAIEPDPVLSAKCESDVLDGHKKESVVKVLLRMPDGRSVQLSGLSVDPPGPGETAVGPIISNNWQIHAGSSHSMSTHNINNSTISPTKPISEPQNGKSRGLSLAKLKLKQALLQNSSNNKAASRKEVNSVAWIGQKTLPNASGKDVSIALNNANVELLSQKGLKNFLANNYGKSSAPNADVGKKRPKSPVDGDGSEKRLKFLERNRAAASRCRIKRKNWIETMQRKSMHLEASNLSLAAEVNSLKAEVNQLRTMLLAHKDCPVTLMMQSQSQGKSLLQPQEEQTAEFPKSAPKQLVQHAKKVGSVIRRPTPKLSIPRKPSEPKMASLSGGTGAGQVLVVSSPQSMASQQGQIVTQQQLLPSIAQTSKGIVIIPSVPGSANISTLCDLQPSRVAVSDSSVDRTVAVVVTNPTVVHAVNISPLNTLPVKLICSTQQFTGPLAVHDPNTVESALVIDKDGGSLSLEKDGKLSDAA